MSETIEGKVPPFGQGLDEGLLTAILVPAGESVERGTAIAEIETAKSTNEVMAEQSGVIEEWLANKGDIMISGDPLYRLRQS